MNTPGVPEWTEAQKRLLELTRLRAAAQQALEQRYRDPWSPSLAETLDSLIRDVHAAERAYRQAGAAGV